MNTLFPIFIKEHTRITIFGGGNVAEEKLHFLLKSSPNIQVKVISKDFSENVLKILIDHQIPFEKSKVEARHLFDTDLIIIAINSIQESERIKRLANSLNVLVNVADTPDLCDFYLGSIVTKGNVKVAISTNGKSPTLSKRLREFFEELLPEEIDELAENLHQYRSTLTGDFQEKVTKLNLLTENVLKKIS